jgi:hypothetical protein
LFTCGPKDRLRCYRVLKEAYSLGSKAVHGGELKEAKKAVAEEALSAQQVLRAADEYLRQALNKIVDRGEFPDWTEVDLGL